MKIKEINKKFMDLYFKGKNIVYQKEDNYIYITDSYIMYKLKEEDFILNINLFKQLDLLNFLNETDYKDSIISDELFIKDKNKLRLIYNNDYKIKINNDYLKYFDNPTLKIKNETSPVLVYENDLLAGLICPIKEY